MKERAMADSRCFLALDLGAESGRAELVTLSGGKVEMQEMHRWPNKPVFIGSTLHWDFPFLLGEITESLRACAQAGRQPLAVGVDTWGVDFGLLCGDVLLGNPVHYRDARTQGIHDYTNPTMTTAEIFALTAYEPWAISSLFQLLAMKKANSPLLEAADSFLNMPDLFSFFLSGVKRSERSIANTSNLMGVDGQWSDEIMRRFSLKRGMFSPLVEPGTVLGPLTPKVRELTGIGDTPVVSVCGHDTSAALAAVPAQGDGWAFISCGTWSILGSMTPQPVATPRCLELGFTNEYTLGGWYLARNISGLWLVQQLRKKWMLHDPACDYTRMTAEASEADGGESVPLFDAADPSLLAPADMEQAIQKLVGPGRLDSRGAMVRSVLESLALEYHRRLESLTELTGRRPDRVYMVGGGIHNKLLCQLTADACGMEVHAGADQCTALGNALTQALAIGVLQTPAEIREVMRNSTRMDVYAPRQQSLWQRKRLAYAQVCS
jgi:rhamnulokinase